ncbi:MAG: putative metalloprotease [Arenicella sp.]|jgi:predicted metalloprotease
MRWRGRRKSGNVEERRGGGFRSGSRSKTVGGGAMLLVVLARLFFGQDVQNILGVLLNTSGSLATHQASSSGNRKTNAASGQQDEASQFVAVILAETEDTWNKVFQQLGERYQPPTLVLYNAQSAICLWEQFCRIRAILLPG